MYIPIRNPQNLQFISDYLGKGRSELTFFVVPWKLDIIWMLLWIYQM